MDANVAERYAESLYQLALEEHALEDYLADMKLVDTVLESNPEFETFFSHVLVDDEAKCALLDKGFGTSVNHYVLNFLKLLVKKRRTRYIAPITKSFIKMSNKHLGIEEGVIFTPFALSDEQVKTIEEAISQKENKTITLRTVEDKTLIGGVKVQIENRVYDGSLKNKVSKLKTELLRK